MLEAAPPGRERAAWGGQGRCHLPWGYVPAKAAVRSREVTNFPLRCGGESLLAPCPPAQRPRVRAARLGQRGSGSAGHGLSSCGNGTGGSGKRGRFPSVCSVQCLVLRQVPPLPWFKKLGKLNETLKNCLDVIFCFKHNPWFFFFLH